MKIDPKAVSSAERPHNEQAILPLVPVAIKYPKERLLQFKLRTTPADADSPTYELSVPCINSTEGTREVLRWSSLMTQVFVGQNATTGPQHDGLVKRTVTETAETAYNEGVKLSRETR